MTHWLFAAENPFRVWGFFPAFIWIAALSVAALAFAGLETLGVLRVHGMVPLTWVLRCLPRWVWFVAAGLAIWHFAFVTTRVH